MEKPEEAGPEGQQGPQEEHPGAPGGPGGESIEDQTSGGAGGAQGEPTPGERTDAIYAGRSDVAVGPDVGNEPRSGVDEGPSPGEDPEIHDQAADGADLSPAEMPEEEAGSPTVLGEEE